MLQGKQVRPHLQGSRLEKLATTPTAHERRTYFQLKNHVQDREEQLARHWTQAVPCSKNTTVSKTTVFR